MAENLEHVMRSSRRGGKLHNNSFLDGINISSMSLEEQRKAHKPKVWDTPAVYLPDELICQILENVTASAFSQRTFASCCLLSRQWYSVAVPFLYSEPYLYGKNFDPFVRTICPSINLHVRVSPLAELVTVLDMGNLVHQGSKSLTARLLRRTKARLHTFVAPQASFAINCLPALSKCDLLRKLDLSLVSESPPLPELFKTVSHLGNLRSFSLPRSSGFGGGPGPGTLAWPPVLEAVNLSGGIDAHFVHGIVAFPPTLRRLAIERCPQAKGYAVNHLLRTAVRSLPLLEELKLAHMPRLESDALDDTLSILPRLRKLSVSIDYVTCLMFDLNPDIQRGAPGVDPALLNNGCALQVLELTNSGNPGVEDKLSPIDILVAIDEGRFTSLRQVIVAKSLQWHSNLEADTEALQDALRESATRDSASPEISAAQTRNEIPAVGVWFIQDVP